MLDFSFANDLKLRAIIYLTFRFKTSSLNLAEMTAFYSRALFSG